MYVCMYIYVFHIARRSSLNLLGNVPLWLLVYVLLSESVLILKISTMRLRMCSHCLTHSKLYFLE